MTKRKFNIIFIILLLLPVVAFFIMNLYSSLFGLNYNTAKMITAPSMPQMSGNSGASPYLRAVKDMAPDYYYNNYNQTSTISDTREFMKVAYNATIATYNDVMGISEKIKDTVKIYDGRMNNYSVSNEYANISFIIPKSNYDDFRKRIQSLTNARLITENMSETNLLNQKVGLEDRADMLQANQTQIDKYKTDMNTSLQMVNSTKNTISVIQKELKALDPNSSDYSNLNMDLQSKLATAQNKLANYNQDYNLKLSIYNDSVANQKTNTTILAKDNTQFDNNIETVDGYISVRSVGVLEYLQMIFPFLYYLFNPFVMYILFIVAVYFILKRKVVNA